MNLQGKHTVQQLADEALTPQPSPYTLIRQLLATTAVALILITLLYWVQGNLSGGDLALGTVTLLALLLGIGLLRTGQVVWAAHGYIAIFWLSLTAYMAIYGSFSIPSPGAYLILVLAAAILLRGRVTFVYTLLSFVAGVLLVLANDIGFLPLYQPTANYIPTVGNNYAKALIILNLLGLAFYSLRHTLATLRFNEVDLQQIRETLGQRTADLSTMNDQLRHEISERQQTEEQFRTLVEASFDGIVICVNQIIMEANINFATMFGYNTVEDVIGKNAATFLVLESVDQLQKKMEENRKISIETVGIRQDNSTFPLEVISRQTNYQGQLAQISGYRDITTRKQAEEAEYHAQKLESLTIMAGGLAHDFNNLLVAMMGQIAIAKAKMLPDHASHENLDKATQATETAALLTRQLLAYTGQGHFEVASLHLNSLISQNLQLFQDALPQNITFRTDLYDPLPHIQADSAQIQQIIMNLLLNAAEAIGTQAGTITITTAPYHLAANQINQWQQTNKRVTVGDFVLLEVADTGRGMDEATRNRIFDPFFSTKGTGRGLGLAAALGIVRGHNGSVRTKSQVGQGTSFQFLFPIHEAEQLEAGTAVSSSKPASQTVLVIDDEKQVREAIGDILDMEEIAVLTAANGKEGIDVFAANQNDVGLIILDLSMPGMSGMETFAALREIDSNAKIILSSGYTEAEAIQKMAGTHPTGFLQKPYRLETVLHTVEKYLHA